jgi:hypothetical protein
MTDVIANRASPPVLLSMLVTVSPGPFPSEVSWTANCSDGTTLSGGAPFSGSFSVNGGSNCTLELADAYGDGWNGAMWTSNVGRNFTLSDGYSASESFSVPLSPPPPRQRDRSCGCAMPILLDCAA